MSQLILTGIGDLTGNLRLEKDPELTVGPSDVLVQLEASPINPVDTLFANGWYPVQPSLPSAIGSEGVGRVVSAADSSLVGKRVVILPTYEQGVWGDQVVVAARNVVVVPEGVDALQLAMLAINPLTAYLILKNFVDLKPGDWVGLNLGNSGMGRNILALAKEFGLKVVTVVRRPSAVAELQLLGADIVLTEGPDLAAQTAEALGSSRLRLVLDGAGGTTTAASLASSLEFGGTVVAYSSINGDATVLPSGTLVFGHVSVRGFWVVNWLRSASRAEIESVFAELASLVARGVISIPVDQTYSLDQWEEAIAQSVSPSRTGKILFVFGR
jgi:NADPH:quinone reductase-like Zn-dependent oxidoreductase